MLLYGCEAPWLMTNNNKTCETNLGIKTMNSADKDKINDFIYKLQLLDLFDFLPGCPKSCITMNIKVKTLISGTENAVLWVLKLNQVCY